MAEEPENITTIDPCIIPHSSVQIEERESSVLTLRLSPPHSNSMYSSSSSSSATRRNTAIQNDEVEALSQLLQREEQMWTSITTPPKTLNYSLTEFESQLRCPICHDLYRIPVFIIPCHHSFCSECIRIALRDGKASMRRRASCPICRIEIGKTGGNLDGSIVPNRALEVVVKKWSTLRSLLAEDLLRLSRWDNAEHALVAGSICNVEKVTDKSDASPAATSGTEIFIKKKRGRPRRTCVSSSALEEEVTENDDDNKKVCLVAPYSPGDTRENCNALRIGQPKAYLLDQSVSSRSASAALRNEELESHISTNAQPQRLVRSTPHYHQLNKKKLQALCSADGLSTGGSEEDLKRRHKDFITLYNAECDAACPMSVQEIAAEIGKREQAQRGESIQSLYSGAASQSNFVEKLKQSRKTLGETASSAPSSTKCTKLTSSNETFDRKFNQGFKNLIAGARKSGIATNRPTASKNWELEGEKIMKRQRKLAETTCSTIDDAKPSSVSNHGKYASDNVLSNTCASAAWKSGSEIQGPGSTLAALAASAVEPNKVPQVASINLNLLQNPYAKASASTPALTTRQAGSMYSPEKQTCKLIDNFSFVQNASISTQSLSTKAPSKPAEINNMFGILPNQTKKTATMCSGPWQCKTCTFVNKTTTRLNAKCEVCRVARQAALNGHGGDEHVVELE